MLIMLAIVVLTPGRLRPLRATFLSAAAVTTSDLALALTALRKAVKALVFGSSKVIESMTISFWAAVLVERALLMASFLTFLLTV